MGFIVVACLSGYTLEELSSNKLLLIAKNINFATQSSNTKWLN